METKSVKINSVDVCYNQSGEGDITLLFVHGAFINKEYWAKQIEYFDNKYKVIALDLPGHGKSGKNRNSWSMGDFGEDISTFISELNLKNVILIGHSMGGDIILEAAVKANKSVIGFIGVDNFKFAGAEFPPQVKSAMDKFFEGLKADFALNSEKFVRTFLVSPATDKPIADRVAYDFKNMDEKIGYDVLVSAMTYYLRERELMGNIHVKMNVISVDNMVINEELLKKYCKNGFEVFHIDGTCHYPMLENSEKFNQVLESAIDKIIEEQA